ncbi:MULTISPECIES: GNAT family N-acetyltransferase [unclassified Pseudomonas]|uniref:GNAT family N-acetyltransferase n=1 Tax=unclassified Pseudomonas TaxID=196821 RepID=UPI002AC9D205|nr:MULTISPECIES: GNAT family N-acetyltransferase [unclassified Pseudomonas]MEB0045568.1 GNAT family N-acetyltransferase [Pseudomonas sp. Dout3]MEB0095451.1 GNAT family N-acetyltransferase [Pseudomonas sp. DC1.2]WPX61035.1 GNAT family N-acetyltransferase [Pseudomonas sp. DC1.2]
MTLHIERSINPTDEERQAILTPLLAYNAAKAGDSESEKVALLVRDDHGEILGGLYGRLFYRWLFIELLSVPEQGRGQGLGSKLMRMAEDLAREKECVGIWLDTFDFQAPQFYKKHGYSELGHIADYPPGHKRFFFQKRLMP